MNLRERLQGLIAEATGLAERSENGQLTAEDEARWEQLRGEISDVRQQLAAEEQRRRDAEEWRRADEELSRSAGRVSGIVPPEQRQGIDPREADRAERRRIEGLAARVVNSEAYRRFAAGNYTGNTGEIDVGTLWRGPFAGGSGERGEGFATPEEQYALIATGALPTDMIAPYRVPGIFAPELPEFNVRSAFLNLQTTAEVITYYRELARDNQAGWVAEASTTAGTDGTKPESGVTWERATSVIETLAHWMPVTNQMLADEPAMRGIIEGVLLDGLRFVEDNDLLNGSGTAPEIQGLLNVPGLQSADAAYFTANPVEDVGTPNENFNRLLRGRSMVRYISRAAPTFYFINPTDMERFMSSTDANRQYMAGGPFAAGAVPTIWRLPAIETEAIAEGTWVCGAGRAAAVFDRMNATITAGWIDKQFVRNMQTILAEERLGLAVFRPSAFVVGAFA